MYPGKVQTKINGDGRLRDATSTKTWIPNQQGKEYSYSKQRSGIFGPQDQFEEHDNFSSPSKGKQVASKNQTGREEPSPIMPMGGVVTSQDHHCRDSSCLRSPSTHSPYPEGSSKELANKSSSLGSQLHNIDLQSKVEDPVVETQFTAEKRLTNTPTSSISLRTNNSCGCL